MMSSNSMAAPVSMVTYLIMQGLLVKMLVKVCSNLKSDTVVIIVMIRSIGQHAAVDGGD